MNPQDGLEDDAASNPYRLPTPSSSTGGLPHYSRHGEASQSNFMSPSSRSESTGQTGQAAPPGKHYQITATLWDDEGCVCFQAEANGITVARRDGRHLVHHMTRLLID